MSHDWTDEQIAEDDRQSAAWAHQQAHLDQQELAEELQAVADQLERLVKDPRLAKANSDILETIEHLAVVGLLECHPDWHTLAEKA